ncbi:MAG: hypothetical protein H0T84_01025 [Tatlockia sp.]|nr:hypothetical protein [Tatlockia sp.]
MTHRIALSPKSQALIIKLKKSKARLGISKFFKSEEPEHVEFIKLNEWLVENSNLKGRSKKQRDEDSEILRASLNAALLKDLAKSLPGYKKKLKPEKDNSWFGRLKNYLYPSLIIAGTIVFGCDGFAGVTSIVSIFPLSNPILFLVGTVFALISMLAFYAFNLTEIAKNLEINRKEARRLVDNYLKEVEKINNIRRQINNDYIRCKTKEELQRDLEVCELLQARYEALETGREVLVRQEDNQKLTVAKYLIASLIGIIYFSGGFFAGQSLATALAGFFVASAATVFWPVVVASFAVGLAALGVYWFVERPSIDKLVSRWFGLEKDKIDELCDAQKIERHTSKLENLKNNLSLRQSILRTDTRKNAEARIAAKKKNLAQSPQDSSFGFFSSSLVTIRPKTKNLIEKLKKTSSQTNKVFKENTAATVKVNKIIKWFNQQMVQSVEGQPDETKLELASLNSALLKDLAISLQDPGTEKRQKKAQFKYRDLMYIFLTISGTIFFGCDGFYGITSIVSMFSIHKIAIFAVGAVFGLISIIAFLAFDLTEIAKNLGMKKKNAHKLVDIYLKEVESIKAIRRSLDSLYCRRQTLKELDDDLLIMELLIGRYNKLDSERKALTQLEADKKLTALKYFISGLISIIYFSTAFFTGQVVALAIAGLFVAGTAPLAWPIVLASVVIGLAALAVYWYVERPSIEKLISSLFGLDQEKIEEFCNSEKVNEEKLKLEQLKINISACKDYMVINYLEDAEFEISQQEANSEMNLTSPAKIPGIFSKTSSSLRKSNSLSDLTIAEEPDSFFSVKRPRSNSLNETQLLTFLNI